MWLQDSHLFHILTDKAEVSVCQNWYRAFWHDALHSFPLFHLILLSLFLPDNSFFRLSLLSWWLSVTLNMLTASESPLGPGESIIWTRINTKRPNPRLATDLASATDWWVDPMLQWAKKHSRQCAHPFSMHHCANTEMHKYTHTQL